jgi:hypothetical protein
MNATPRTPPRPNAKPHWLILNVGVRVDKVGVPTDDFDLIDTDHTKFVHPLPRREIDLSALDQKVLIVFTLVDTLGLMFRQAPGDCIGLEASETCPDSPSNATGGMFRREGLSQNRRQLAVLDQNPGNGMKYRFALFMEDQTHQVVAVCDPRIVNN